MKLVLPDDSKPMEVGLVRRTASTYRAQVLPLWEEGEDVSLKGVSIKGVRWPRPWVVLEVTDSSVPLGALDFKPDLLGGTVFVGYGDVGLPGWLMDDADLHVHIEQFDDTPRVTQWDAVAIYLHAAFVAMRSR